MDAEKQAAALRERYGRNRAAPIDSNVVPQRMLLPSVEDPHIWRIKCRPGKEREVVFAIQKRKEDRLGTREPLQIISAFERGGVMAGNLYCEARMLSDVMTAIDGLQNVFMGTKPMLIPIPEMPDLLRTTKSKELEPGMYIRVKRGLYSGDLGQVQDVELNGAMVTVKLIPRLAYGQDELDDPQMVIDPVTGKRKRAGPAAAKARPAQRLFSETEARKKHGARLGRPREGVLTGNRWVYENELYVDGYLVKDFRLTHLQTEDVNPSLEEVTKFAAGNEEGTETLDLSALAATIKSNSAGAFLPGDMVEIFQGEQRGVFGRATAVHGDIVRISVTEGPLKGQNIESPVKGLRKLFREGDHVKVIGGSKYFDEVGMVVKIVEDRVTILTDSTQQEITVFSKDLREASDSGGQVGISKYDLHDLVQLDAATVGCVIKVDRESLRVLDQTGTVRSMLPSQISNKLERRKNAVATDREGAEIRIDDTIKEYGGESKSGRVLHLHRNFLFAHNRESLENAGVFVVRTNNVITVAAKGGRAGGIDLMKMNPALQRNGAKPSPAMPPPRQMGKDRLIGKTVAARTGPYKGLLGIVKETTDTHARIELYTKKNIVNVEKEKLTVRDPNTGEIIQSDALRGGRPGGMGPRMGGGATSYGGATPGGRFGATPRGADGGRTPAWKTSGGRTPAWQSGAKTPYGGVAAAGGKTPAWGMGSGGGTAYGGTTYGGGTAYGGSTAYGGVSRFAIPSFIETH